MNQDVKHELVIPAFGKSPAQNLDMTKTNEGLTRLVEAKMVNPITYTDLEHSFNEAYRELVRHSATVGYQLAMADKALQTAKSNFLIDKYPEIIKDWPKSKDSADLRNAYLMRENEYVEALDRVSMLKAIQAHIDGRIKVFENVCRYMKKQMDLLIRSGMSSNMYLTHGKR